MSDEFRQFRATKRWEGVVTKTVDDHFMAELRDLDSPSNPVESVEISRQDVSPADQSLICDGSVFYWIVGQEMRAGGQIATVSEIRFQRMPVMEAADAH